MKTFIFILFFLNIFTYSPENIDQSESETKVTFKVKNMGIFVDGKFTEVAIESKFNLEDLTNSNIHASIKVNSLDTDNNKRDKDLLKSKYFDVDKFPEINFKSTKIKKSLEDGKFILTGNLRIKNTEKLVDIPFKIVKNGENQIIEADFTLNRRDYEIGGKSWVMSDEVIINVNYKINK